MATQICTRCVMDTSDPEIRFDSDGVCSHCHDFAEKTPHTWFPNEEGERRLRIAIDDIKQRGKGKEYDCVMGLSGGIDSSYLAVKIKEYGLRPLVVHVDAGWNSELAVHNIEQVVKACDYDLHTHVMDWDEIRDLQLAFLKAGVANQDVVQDHAFFSSLYHFAVQSGIKDVISGGNIATESMSPNTWHHSAMDAKSIHAIHKRYGTGKLKHYKTISLLQYYIYYPYIYGMKTLRPLNYMPYSKTEAFEFLKQEVGYKEYGRKHGESVFTKFFQNYYLPTKFGMDKRKPHYSSMIASGQITREQALEMLQEPLYGDTELAEDKQYIAKKLGISENELDDLIHSKGVHYTEYANWDRSYALLKRIQAAVESLTGRRVRNYS